MQTFLPYASFTRSARVLDDKRLGKQRVEALQLLRLLTGYDESNRMVGGSCWQSHPAVRMWLYRPYALALYNLAICREWQSRGFKDTCEQKTYDAFVSPVALSLFDSPDFPLKRLQHLKVLPWWFGRQRFHEAHRLNLMRKKYEHYGPLIDPDGLIPWTTIVEAPYLWPHPIERAYRELQSNNKNDRPRY